VAECDFIPAHAGAGFGSGQAGDREFLLLPGTKNISFYHDWGLKNHRNFPARGKRKSLARESTNKIIAIRHPSCHLEEK
jgi:hypothetical protein